jgi:ethanolamine utilization protein EutQ
MPTLIPQPTRIQSSGNKPKLIDEYIGRVNSKTSSASVAHMRSPAGWLEPGQTPAFDEFTIVLKGTLHVEHENGSIDVAAGQAVIAYAGEWIRYCPPSPWTRSTATGARAENRELAYSHSIVPGGLEVMSYTTRFTPFTSFTIREEIVFNTSCGSATQSAVMPSSELTARIAHV